MEEAVRGEVLGGARRGEGYHRSMVVGCGVEEGQHVGVVLRVVPANSDGMHEMAIKNGARWGTTSSVRWEVTSGVRCA
jgi:hypothetical protein